MKGLKFLSTLLEAVKGKYNLHEVDPDGEAIEETFFIVICVFWAAITIYEKINKK